MRSFLICTLASSLILATPFAMADASKVKKVAVADIKDELLNKATQKKADKVEAIDQSAIVANVLCQNVPAFDPKNRVQSLETYAKYIEQVSELFGSHAKKISSDVVGINKDYRMRYELNNPINVVGILFNTVNIVTLKGQEYNYYQITATKPMTSADEGLVRDIPQSDKLTVSIADKTLSIMCNVRAPIN